MAATELVFHGVVKMAGLPPFEFSTKAVSDKKARSNGLAQYAKRLNMSIPALNRYVKQYPPKIDIQPEVK